MGLGVGFLNFRVLELSRALRSLSQPPLSRKGCFHSEEVAEHRDRREGELICGEEDHLANLVKNGSHRGVDEAGSCGEGGGQGLRCQRAGEPAHWVKGLTCKLDVPCSEPGKRVQRSSCHPSVR